MLRNWCDSANSKPLTALTGPQPCGPVFVFFTPTKTAPKQTPTSRKHRQTSHNQKQIKRMVTFTTASPAAVPFCTGLEFTDIEKIKPSPKGLA